MALSMIYSRVLLVIGGFWHLRQTAKGGIKTNQALVSLEYLPTCSPEHNPDEHLNSELKASVHQKQCPRDLLPGIAMYGRISHSSVADQNVFVLILEQSTLKTQHSAPIILPGR